MNLPFFIARRYFLSKKKKNFINIISLISMLVVGIGTMALIIVLSVFNGLEGLLRSIYGSFDPDIYITATEGKSFHYTDDSRQIIQHQPGVVSVTDIIEDNVLIKYKNSQRVVRMKGVSESFLAQNRIQQSLVYGEAKLSDGDFNYAILGRGIQYDLSINPDNEFYTIQIYYPKNIRPGVLNPTSLYSVKHIIPAGIFAIEKYYDENYLFVPLAFANSLLNYQQRRTGIEIELSEDVDANTVKADLQRKLGSTLHVRLGEEIHQDLYKILKIEKLFVYIIFSLIIGIASINIYFALTMLVIDKRKDIAVLSTQGAPKSLIRKIFLYEGSIVALTGALVGMVLGLTISLLQQEFKIISMGAQTTIMDAYPIKVEFLDVFLSMACIVTITLIAAVPPAKKAAEKISMRTL
ncbi:MAG: FtsX-like permease family protein [Cyclobacteriaceae bacterium]